MFRLYVRDDMNIRSSHLLKVSFLLDVAHNS